MQFKTFGDLVQGRETAEISCLYSGKVVRKLHRVGDTIYLDPIEGPILEVPANRLISFEPWMMDRGSLIFAHDSMPGKALKLCGEGDTITWGNGEWDTVMPHPEAPLIPHKVQFNVF